MTRGFTLIETIIYLALLFVLITGAVQSFSSIEQAAADEHEAATSASEGMFVMQKIAWTVHAGLDPRVVQFDSSMQRVVMKEKSGELVPLTTSNVNVTGLILENITDSDGSIIGTDVALVLDGEAFQGRYYELP